MIAAVLGWVGTAGTFAAYALLVQGRVTSTSLRYSLLNVVGGLLAGTAGVLYGAWPSVVSNAVWAGFGLHSLVSTLRARRGPHVAPDRDPDPLPPPVDLATVRARRPDPDDPLDLAA